MEYSILIFRSESVSLLTELLIATSQSGLAVLAPVILNL